MSPVFIWQTLPTWFRPLAQQERMTVISSTCWAIWGYHSLTQRPLLPCCFQVRGDAMRLLLPVPMAVKNLPNAAGIGWTCISFGLGLGAKRSRCLGATYLY